MQNNEQLTAEMDALRIKLAKETEYRKNVEAAFKRLLFAVEKQSAIIGPIMMAFKGIQGKSGLASAGQLPMIINKVMGMMDENKSKVLIEVSEQDVYPILTQYIDYYKSQDNGG